MRGGLNKDNLFDLGARQPNAVTRRGSRSVPVPALYLLMLKFVVLNFQYTFQTAWKRQNPLSIFSRTVRFSRDRQVVTRVSTSSPPMRTTDLLLVNNLPANASLQKFLAPEDYWPSDCLQLSDQREFPQVCRFCREVGCPALPWGRQVAKRISTSDSSLRTVGCLRLVGSFKS